MLLKASWHCGCHVAVAAAALPALIVVNRTCCVQPKPSMLHIIQHALDLVSGSGEDGYTKRRGSNVLLLQGVQLGENKLHGKEEIGTSRQASRSVCHNLLQLGKTPSVAVESAAAPPHSPAAAAPARGQAACCSASSSFFARNAKLGWSLSCSGTGVSPSRSCGGEPGRRVEGQLPSRQFWQPSLNSRHMPGLDQIAQRTAAQPMPPAFPFPARTSCPGPRARCPPPSPPHLVVHHALHVGVGEGDGGVVVQQEGVRRRRAAALLHGRLHLRQHFRAHRLRVVPAGGGGEEGRAGQVGAGRGRQATGGRAGGPPSAGSPADVASSPPPSPALAPCTAAAATHLSSQYMVEMRYSCCTLSAPHRSSVISRNDLRCFWWMTRKVTACRMCASAFHDSPTWRQAGGGQGCGRPGRRSRQRPGQGACCSWHAGPLHPLPCPQARVPHAPGAHPLLARAADPLLHLGQPRLDVLAVGEGAALAAQQQLVEQLHVDKGQQLLKQLLHQEGRHVVLPQRGQQRVKHAQDAGPLRR